MAAEEVKLGIPLKALSIMAEELSTIFKRFALSDKECSEIIVETEESEKGLQDCRLSLCGKVVGEKSANVTGVKNVANQLWGYPKKMEVVEIGRNLFQFNFVDMEELIKVMDRRPYLIDNQILNLRRWEAGIDKKLNAFNLAPLWVQIWGLPVHCITKEIGKKIGSVFESVLEVVIPTGGSKEGRHVKILCELDTTQPLLRGTTVKIEGCVQWVEFRYERAPDFCYKCGIIGHGEKGCNAVPDELLGGRHKQYGTWMRVQGLKASARQNRKQGTPGTEVREAGDEPNSGLDKERRLSNKDEENCHEHAPAKDIRGEFKMKLRNQEKDQGKLGDMELSDENLVIGTRTSMSQTRNIPNNGEKQTGIGGEISQPSAMDQDVRNGNNQIDGVQFFDKPEDVVMISENEQDAKFLPGGKEGEQKQSQVQRASRTRVKQQSGGTARQALVTIDMNAEQGSCPMKRKMCEQGDMQVELEDKVGRKKQKSEVHNPTEYNLKVEGASREWFPSHP